MAAGESKVSLAFHDIEDRDNDFLTNFLDDVTKRCVTVGMLYNAMVTAE